MTGAVSEMPPEQCPSLWAFFYNFYKPPHAVCTRRSTADTPPVGKPDEEGRCPVSLGIPWCSALKLRSATLPVLGGQDKAPTGMRVREMVTALKTNLYVSQAAHGRWVSS